MSWKKYQQKFKFVRWLKRVGIAFLVLVLVGGVIGLYKGFAWLASSPAQSDQFWQESTTWDGQYQLNLWLPQGGLLIALDAENSTLRYERLGEKGEEIKRIRRPIDSYLLFPSDSSFFSGASLRLVSLRQLFAARTNLSRRQLLKLWWELKQIKKGGIVETRDFSEAAIKAERLKVMVLNSSDVPGLAAQGAEWVESVGAEVIALGNADGEEESGVGAGKGNMIKAYNVLVDSRTVQRLEQIFKVQAELISTDSPQRTDVVVVVQDL